MALRDEHVGDSLSEVGVVLLDARARIVDLDTVGARALGLTRQEAVGLPFAEAVRSDALSTVLEPPLEGATAEVTASVVRNPDVLVVLSSSRLAEGVAIRLERSSSRARSDRMQRAQARLGEALTRREVDARRRAERSFHDLIENAPVNVFAHREGVVTFVNPAFAAFLGHERDELLGRRVEEILPPSERAIFFAQSEGVLDRGDIAPRHEFAFLRKDGSVAFAEMSGVRCEVDGVPMVVAIGHDVGSRRKLTAQMMEMDRMIAVGTLAAGVAHEINNPLAYVLANIDFAREELALATDPETKRIFAEVLPALDDAQTGARRVRDIVRDLKTFSRQDRDEVETVALETVLESAVGMTWNEMRHRAQVVREIQPTPAVLGNDSRLGQVFLNLLVNAAHAIPEGRASENRIVVRAFGEGAWAVVEIEDTGAGIPPENLSRIFDPFFTTKEIGQGTGLGLSISRGIVTALRGTIDVHSQPGKTVFRVRLPALTGTISDVAAPRPGARAGRRGRILVVDDEPLVLTAIRRAIESVHDVEQALGGREALQKLAASPFDLVLCDLMMPDVDGIDVHDALTRTQPEMAGRLVFLTGGAFTPRARDFLKRDGVPVLEKPFDPQELRALLRARLG